MLIFVALVHHPVLNRDGQVVTTAVTNVDIHDVARSARTYGCRAAFIVTPISEQRRLCGRILTHWLEGDGAVYNPHRADAMSRLVVLDSLEAARAHIRETTGFDPLLVVTGAKLREGITPYAALRRRIETEDGALLLCFGTGHGLAPEVIDSATLRLPALEAASAQAEAPSYNHLSVRSALAIILDRLLGNLDA
jgi:hypothetical protein